jgi:hypothetical protein
MTTHAETAAATRAVYAALWLPTPSVIALVEAAADANCLDPDSVAWLGRVQKARRMAKIAEAIEAIRAQETQP